MNAATQIIIDRYELTNLIIEAVKMGVDKYIQMPKKDTISRRTACRMYGNNHVNRWIKNGFIYPILSDNTENKKYSLYEFQNLANRENLSIKSAK